MLDGSAGQRPPLDKRPPPERTVKILQVVGCVEELSRCEKTVRQRLAQRLALTNLFLHLHISSWFKYVKFVCGGKGSRCVKKKKTSNKDFLYLGKKS